MKISILYHSKTGNTKEMADVIAQGILKEDVKVKTFSIDDIDEAWVKESSCVIVGTPIYMATTSASIKVWLDTNASKLNLAGKIGGAFATAEYIHGGAEIGIQSILDHMLVFGMLVYSGGFALGDPVIHLGPVGIAGKLDESKETFELYGQRMASKTKEIFK
ncbi:NAD(P)H dehydrogenase (quinone) [Bacilli bacterium PM5-9]|nr:NAD(P)H dehydrogenase (quinone) [Bacilli bacterium PM5-9]